MHNNDNDADDELSPVDAAEYLGRHPSSLAQWRTFRRGPRYRKASDRRVFYLRADLDEWLAEQGGRGRARFSP